MRRRHGDITKLLIDDRIVLFTRNLHQPIRVTVGPDLEHDLALHGIALTEVGEDAEKLFRFNFMFRDAGLPSYEPVPADLIQLGNAMTNTATTSSTSSLRAGYTFLGQFIDHDLTFNANQDLTLGGQPIEPKSKRSPSLDLDSLYGLDPGTFKETDQGKIIYNDVKLTEGQTDGEGTFLASTSLKYFHDLPRLEKSRVAALVDARNDENLAVAQTHLAFIKFHNAMVDHLSESVAPELLFEKARENVIRDYQRVILDDFLPSIMEPQVVTQMQNEGPSSFLLTNGEDAFMPLEFAFAAFRMGHSLVTSRYEWNRVFQSDRPQPQPASLQELMIFSANGTFENRWRLPSHWIIDWTRFFDFTGIPVAINEPFSHAGTIDAFIEQRLAQLNPIHIPNHGPTTSLAVRNLVRGLDVGLPSGQAVAKHLGYPELKPENFTDLPYFNTLHQLGFDELTPLWLYILHEAKVQNGGNYLGFVGSRIVAETFLTLIAESRITVLPRGTKWKTPQVETKFGMANLLAFVNDFSENKDFLNPLG